MYRQISFLSRTNKQVGPVLSDLASKRRGQVRQVLSGSSAETANTSSSSGSSSNSAVPEQAVILADTPLAELRDYATALRSVTAGSGSFAMEFAEFRPVPQHVVTALQKN